jgi:hypothetical protein
MRYTLFILFVTVIFFSSCKKKKLKPEMILPGTWKAGNLVIGDSLSNVDLSPVRLVFSKNSRYYYMNNMAQVQAGTYIVRDSLLITSDTTSNPLKETAVHIVKSTKDSLVLRMNMDSSETLLYLIK